VCLCQPRVPPRQHAHGGLSATHTHTFLRWCFSISAKEVADTDEKAADTTDPNLVEGMWVVPMHSALKLDEQKMAFWPAPEGECRFANLLITQSKDPFTPTSKFLNQTKNCK